MTEENAILTACVFMLDNEYDVGRDYSEPYSADLFQTGEAKKGIGIGGFGDDAKIVNALASVENRPTWLVLFWDNERWLPPGVEILHYPIEVWVDDMTGEAWWIEDDGKPTQTSWRK